MVNDYQGGPIEADKQQALPNSKTDDSLPQDLSATIPIPMANTTFDIDGNNFTSKELRDVILISEKDCPFSFRNFLRMFSHHLFYFFGGFLIMFPFSYLLEFGNLTLLFNLSFVGKNSFFLV